MTLGLMIIPSMMEVLSSGWTVVPLDFRILYKVTPVLRVGFFLEDPALSIFKIKNKGEDSPWKTQRSGK